MKNSFDGLSTSARWRLLVEAAKKAVLAEGYSMVRVPGRGLSNIWNLSKNEESTIASIRTTRDRWIAFPPLANGTKWKTLSDVDTVIVATVDSKQNPKNVEVYIFPAEAIRQRFDAAYAARKKEGQTVKDDFGMWVGLDKDDRGIAASVGSGIVEHYACKAVFAISELLDESQQTGMSKEDEAQNKAVEATTIGTLSTIGEVMSCARQNIARLAAVSVEAVKLDLKIEY